MSEHAKQEMIHEILPVGWLQCNCHVVGDPATREAIVIDPGDDTEKILDVIARHKFSVKAILITHAHIDHVGGLRKLHDATQAPVLMHPDDFELYAILDQQAAMIGMRMPDAVKVDGALREGDTVRWGPNEVRVIHTPGHTRGSVSLYMPAEIASGAPAPAGKLFAGDTLFAGSIGRTDLWGGSFEAIIRSIQSKLLSLPEDTIVFPGHGRASTIGEERESNPFLRSR
jgi:glyoxylase-like metal-dependent hydrolase (beta-lactamase superfamily II)